MKPSETGTIPVSRRRHVEYRRFGARDGRPVIYAHGLPGSANEAGLADDFGKTHGLDIIALSRPGIGGSDFQHNRVMTHWPDDVQRVADGLRITEFDLMGMSGGGPYALVCAHRLHGRAQATSLIASPSEFVRSNTREGMPRKDRLFLWLAKYVPVIARGLLEYKAHCERRRPGTFFQELISKASDADRVLLEEERTKAVLVATIQDVISRGMRGLLREIQLFNSPWGFQPEEIPASHPVRLLHGTHDETIPLTMSRELHAMIPHADATFLDREGHFMLAQSVGKCRALLAEFFARPRMRMA